MTSPNPDRLTLFAFEKHPADGSTQIRVVRELSAQETADYRAAAREFYSYATWQFSIRVVEENYRDFLSSLAELGSFRPRLDPKLELAAALHLGVNRRLGNLLSSARLFLDHTETRLKRRYGKESTEVVTFKELTANAYDSSFAYRFLYRLRNYAQHCGMPVGNIEHSASAGTRGEPDTYRLDYSFDAQDLVLQGRDLWGNIEAELRAGPADLPVHALVDEMMQRLRDIDTGVFKIEHPALSTAANRIMAIISAARGPRVMPQIGFIEPDAEGPRFTFEDVPLTIMAAAGFIRLNVEAPD